MAPLILLAFMAVFGYFMLIRPMRMQKAARAAMLANLREGAEVLTVGGIFGRVTELREEDLDVEVADGVVLRVSRQGVASVAAEPVAPDTGLGERTDAEAD
jgi:preprotein translocase subunit YajC